MKISKTAKQPLDEPVIPLPSVVAMNWNPENSKEKVFCIRNFETPAVVYIHINQPQVDSPQQSNTSIINEAKLATILGKIKEYKKHDNQLRHQQQQQQQQQDEAGSELNKRTPTQTIDDGTMKSAGVKRNHMRSRALSMHQSAYEYESSKERSQLNLINQRRPSVSIDRPASNTYQGLLNSNVTPLQHVYSDHSYTNGSVLKNPSINPISVINSITKQTIAPQITNVSNVLTINRMTNQIYSAAPAQPLIQRAGPGTTIFLQPIAPTPQFNTTLGRKGVAMAQLPTSQSNGIVAQPKENSLKILSVDDINSGVSANNANSTATGRNKIDNNIDNNIDNINDNINDNLGYSQIAQSDNRIEHPRVKYTPIRPKQPNVHEDNANNDSESISVSLSRTSTGELELSLSSANKQRIDYDALNVKRKGEVQNCLIKDDIWLKMLDHIKKEGTPTLETLELFKKILPQRERNRFFAEFNYARNRK